MSISNYDTIRCSIESSSVERVQVEDVQALLKEGGKGQDNIFSFIHKLGNYGFIVPSIFSYSDMLTVIYKYVNILTPNLMKRVLSRGATEEEFYHCIVGLFIEDIYHINNSSGYAMMKKRIKTMVEHDANLFEKLAQCFICYEKNLYYPCVCGTLPLVDLLLEDKQHPCDTRMLRHVREEKKLAKQEGNREQSLILENVEGFIEILTKSEPFSGKEPWGMNRHWLLHGRSNASPIKSDCLKIFSIIDVTLELNYPKAFSEWKLSIKND